MNRYFRFSDRLTEIQVDFSSGYSVYCFEEVDELREKYKEDIAFLDKYFPMNKKIGKNLTWSEIFVLDEEEEAIRVKFLYKPDNQNQWPLFSGDFSEFYRLIVKGINSFSDRRLSVDDIKAVTSSEFIEDFARRYDYFNDEIKEIMPFLIKTAETVGYDFNKDLSRDIALQNLKESVKNKNSGIKEITADERIGF